jgi:hypothetical protein
MTNAQPSHSRFSYSVGLKYTKDHIHEEFKQYLEDSSYTEVSSRIGFWAGSKRRKSTKKKRAALNQYIPLFFSRFAAAFNPAKKPILELTSVYTQPTINLTPLGRSLLGDN